MFPSLLKGLLIAACIDYHHHYTFDVLVKVIEMKDEDYEYSDDKDEAAPDVDNDVAVVNLSFTFNVVVTCH